MRKFLKRALAIALTAVMVVQPMTAYTDSVMAADESVSITINGYQISSIVGGYRTIYTLNDPNAQIAVNEDGSAKVGLVYGLGSSITNPDTDMVVGSTGSNIVNYPATIGGKSDITYGEGSSAQSYTMTMQFGDSISPSFFNASIYVRAYAQLKDGTYIYSNAKSLTIYKLADYLYQNIMMNNEQGHNYLYNNILSVINSSYAAKEYDWNHSIVPAETVSQKPTEKPSEDTTEKTTEKQTEKPTEAPTVDIDPGEITNLCNGKVTATASSQVWNYSASNAIDGNTDTYWEGSGSNQTLSINLKSDSEIAYVIVKLNPNSAWSARTQRIEVLGHTQYETNYTTMLAAADYQFDPASGNQIKIPVTGKASDIQLMFISNSGSGGGQAAEVEIYGIPADNPDLTITDITANKTSLYENEELVISAVVANKGTLDAPATTLSIYLDEKKVDTVDVKALKPGETTTVEFNAGTIDAGQYAVSAVVDEDDKIIERREDNNSVELSSKITIKEVESVDLVPVVSWVPSNPSQGSQADFNVQITNNGNQVTKDSSHIVTVRIKDESGNVVQTFTQTANGTIAVKDTMTISMGKWTVGEGKFTIETTVSADSGELDVKQKNNTVTSSLYVGRGADMPFTVLEAENAKTNGTVLKKNFTLADFAGEASGRSAVKLDQNGQYVEFTLTSSANAFVLRNAVDEGVDGTISLYADGSKVSSFNVTSHFSRVRCSADDLNNLGKNDAQEGDETYWLYEDSQLLLDKTYPAGTKIKIQKDAGDVNWIYVDMIETEEVAPAVTNPDPNQYVEVSNSKSIETALNEARMNNKKGIFIPAGEWELSSMISVYGGAFEIVGAGPWHTKLVVPQDRNNTDAGFRIDPTASGSTIRDLSAWGNYTYRQDGPGKFINGDKMQNVTVDNVWAEHFVCLYWGVGSSNNTFKNCRIKNLFADGINMTNGSNNNEIINCYARATGDDSFALFSATDNGGDYNVGNHYANLTAVCPRRAACFAIYGGSDNVYENLYGADTLTYPGITMSSLSFGYQTKGFGDKDCIVENVTLDRCGGDFYTSRGSDDHFNDYQNFGAIWIYAGDRIFQNVVLRNIDINDAVYYGIQIQTMYSGGPASEPMKNVTLENININNANRQGIKFLVCAEEGQGPCVGSATFRNVQINNAKLGSVYGLDRCPDFTAIKENCNW